MTFLASVYLWLLPLISLPLIFHLLKKRNIKNISFSTLRFFNLIEDSSLKKINLVNILLLIIRTLIILFFILIISKPYLNGLSRDNRDKSKDICIILVDNSYSNKNSLDRNYKSLIKQITDAYDDESVINIGIMNNDYFIHDTFNKNFNYEINPINISYGSHPLNISDLLNDADFSMYDNKDIFIISDMHQKLFENKIDYNLDDWNIFLYKLEPNNDTYISSLNIKNDFILKDDLIEIDITVVNNTDQDIEDEEIMLFIDGTNVASNICNIKSKNNALYSFKTTISTTGNHNCYFTLNESNKYFFNINIDNNTNIAVISNSISNSKYLLNALEAFNDVSNTVNIQTFTSDEFIRNNLKFNSVVKFDTSDMDNELLNRIYLFTDNLIILPSNTLDMATISDYFKLDINGQVKNNSLGNSYISINKNLISDKNIKNFFTKDNTVKIYNYFELPKSKNSIILLDNNISFLNQYKKNNKTLSLFSSPFDIESSNLVINSAFFPMINHLIVQSNNRYNYEIGDTIFFSNTNISDKVLHITNNDTSTYTFGNLYKSGLEIKKPGYHKFIYSGNEFNISSNININEHEHTESNSSDMGKIFTQYDFIDNLNDLSYILNTHIAGKHLWRYFLYIIILLIIIEMYLSNIYVYKND